ncbi:MAG: pilus assembly protein [Chloroflexales bacterium]|nr:pilus assembly protein [Chloroflexales bacterium]
MIRHRAPAQAIIEFALASTLIFFLLAAVIDLGLIYFTMQALRVAAQEGATYGSYPKAEMTDTNGDGIGDQLIKLDFDYQGIVFRVYGAGGEQEGGFANLRDLNSNGQDDLNVDHLHDNMISDPNAYIYIENLVGLDPENLSSLGCRGDTKGQGLQNGGQGCWIRVTVRYDYKFAFPLAPAFADTVQLKVSHLTPVRSSFYTR